MLQSYKRNIGDNKYNKIIDFFKLNIEISL